MLVQPSGKRSASGFMVASVVFTQSPSRLGIEVLLVECEGVGRCIATR
uniref:Unannotated protein n=1 Tax=freshwater metagenome TaxID=449393 RepID=A0A6J7M8R3_9ZZZZ